MEGNRAASRLGEPMVVTALTEQYIIQYILYSCIIFTFCLCTFSKHISTAQL